jgi:hypothetical protein
MLSGRPPDLVDLDQHLTGSEQILDPRPAPDHEILEKRVATVTTSNPDHSGWRSTARLDLNEIDILADDHGICLPGLLENLRILCRDKTKVLNVKGLTLAKLP